jgi:hypothetical protein
MASSTKQPAAVDRDGKPRVPSVYDSLEMTIERDGTKIVLPLDPKYMTLEEGKRALERAIEAENQVYAVSETINAHFFDGLVALTRALKHKYGFVANPSQQTFFGPVPPRFIHVKTGPGERDFEQVPFGQIKIPGIEGMLETGYIEVRGIPMATLNGTVKAKEKAIVMELIILANEFVKTNSVYRGRSIILERDERNDNLNFDAPLSFFDPASGMEVPIFTKATEELIRVAVMAPLKNSAACKKAKIPLKRGVLFEGPFGCGKSLVSKQVAKVANENNWTFILVTAAGAMKYALTFAKLYQPCVVFVEDIDRVTGNRSEKTNDLINEIDGVVGKNDEIMVVMTTNHADKIDKAMLRPGRLDAVVSIRPPDAEAAMRLVKFYGGDSLDPKADLTEAAAMIEGHIPATIREVVERAKLGMIADGRKQIGGEHLVISATSMQNHMDLYTKANTSAPHIDPITETIRKTIHNETIDVLEKDFGLGRRSR